MNLRDSLILLAATAIVSGFLVPFVLKRIDSQREAQAKDRDLKRVRRDRLIDAQVAFLDRLTETLWSWRYLVMRITYYGGIADEQGFEKARQAYNEKFWFSLNEIRVEISKSSRLVSTRVLEDLRGFYNSIVALDRDLLSAAAIEDVVERRMTYMDLNHKVFGEISDQIDNLLSKVADDLHLSKKTV